MAVRGNRGSHREMVAWSWALLLALGACVGEVSGADASDVGQADADTRDGPDDPGDGGTQVDSGLQVDSGSSLDSGTAPTCEQSSHSGEGTYYAADGTGHCSFPASPGDLMVAAMNVTDYALSEVCGTCVHLTGPQGSVTVRIVDECPECAPGDIDLSPEAFQHIAELVAGRVAITWRYVPCEVSGPIRYHFKEGSNQWWSAVQVRNHRHQVASLEYLSGGTNWLDVTRLDYNFFVEGAGMGPGPYTFRVTDIYGQTLEDSGIGFVEGGVVDGSGQFPPCED